MSRDIRSFFQVKKAQKPVIEDDDDVIPESPEVQIIKNKKKDVKKKRVFNDDSDEEIFSSKKKKNSSETQSQTSNNKNKSPKPALKEVKAIDIFGSAPIKRTEPLVKKKKKTELGIHSDDEFEKSLLEIDNAELESKSIDDKASKEKTPTNSEQDKPTSSKDKIKDLEKTDSKETSLGKKHTSSTHTEKKKELNKTDESKLSKVDKKVSTSIDSENKNSIQTETKKESHKRAETKSSKVEKKVNQATSNDSENKNSTHTESKKESNKTDESKSSKADKNVNQSTKFDSESGEIKKSKLDNSKRKFAEFVDNDSGHDHTNKKTKLNESCEAESRHNSTVIEDGDDKDKNKKKKLNKSLNESVLTDEERHERRMQSAALYKTYLNRSGPKHLGAKEIPEGKPNCLKDCAFVVTGVLDSFEKDEIAAAINQYGGSVKSGVSRKVTHVVAGEDAGPAKMAKAQELGIKIINEDEFLKMITDRSQNKPTDKPEIKKEIKKDKTPMKKASKDKLSPKEKSEKDKKDNHVDSKLKGTDNIKSESKSRESSLKREEKKPEVENKSKEEPKTENSSSGETSIPVKNAVDLMWVDKHKPQTIKNIIGQHGQASSVKKLLNWLTNWYSNRKLKLIKPNPWQKNSDGGYFKAVLLSGPPGVGKTTSVALVCKELGFDVVEFNASDTRNKTLIKQQIGELLTTNSLSGYAKGDTGKQAVTKKHVLVMDEVDGMAGNEDRGGIQELISLIKTTSVPIICMCNDRKSQKMRSLVNYCYDLRFDRPRVDQIKSAMLSICFKEGIKIPADVLTQLIVSANQDVRQTLNLLSMWAADPSRADGDSLRNDVKTVRKDIKLGPWEATRKVFSAEDHKTMSINDKSDLFFYDYSFMPLFVQENFINVVPHCHKDQVLETMSKAADSISLGDLVDARIRRQQAWSLLPTQAMYSSVIPGFHMSGHWKGQIQFPSWLAKNSKASKMRRLCQEIHAHTRLSTSGSKSSIYLDYGPHLRDAIASPLIKDKSDGITQSIQVLESYHLLRDDLNSLVELTTWTGQTNVSALIDARVKSAMTREYHKKATALPYAPGAVKRLEAKGDELGYEDDEEEQDEPNSDPENDDLIKKKPKETAKASTSKGQSRPKASTSKKKKEK